jgi:hypothetical protein
MKCPNCAPSQLVELTILPEEKFSISAMLVCPVCRGEFTPAEAMARNKVIMPETQERLGMDKTETFASPEELKAKTNEPPEIVRPAMTEQVQAMAERLMFGPPPVVTPSRNNDAHIILDKELRRDIDAIIQRLKNGTGELNTPPIPVPYAQRKSRERSLAITKLQEAVMWLGMDLKAINDENPGTIPNPYPHSKDPSTSKIDPTADGLKL